MSKSSLLRYILAAVALTGACASGILGVASFLFQRGDRHSVELAARLVPFNPVYLSRLSSYHPDQRTDLLHKAATLNPYSEQVWLQLGFDAEFRHNDFAAAEKYYLQSAEVSHLFLPRWTLANFYFRRQNKPAFMQWAHSALLITPYSADPIFTEMWLIDPDPAHVAASIPNRPAILEQYFIFLMNARQFASAPAIAERLVRSAGPADAQLYGLNDVFGPALDRLLGSGYVPEALRTWNSLSVAHWIRFSTPTSDQPLTNGQFAPLFAHGFDWIPIYSVGISSTAPGTDHDISFELSGEQPETCSLLQQWLPVSPSRRYRLQWKAHSEDLALPTGLNWHIRTLSLDLQSPDLLASNSLKWDFQISADTRIVLLMLEYRRPLGMTKAKGTLRLQDVALQPE